MSDLIVQVPDLVIFGSFILVGLENEYFFSEYRSRQVIFSNFFCTNLLHGQFEIFDIFLQTTVFLFQFLFLLEQLVSGIFLLLEAILRVLNSK